MILKYILSTFFNNSLSIVITIAGIILSSQWVQKEWQLYKINKANKDRIELITETYDTRDKTNTKIAEEAKDAREDLEDWDFINQ